MLAVFYISAAVAIFATIMVITRFHAVEALLYLIVSLLAVAVVFYQLGAPFLAALEVIIYAGAIMVLFVFVVMLLNLGAREAEQEKAWLSPGMYVGPVVLAVIIGAELIYLLVAPRAPAQPETVISPKTVGITLYTVYPIAIELVGLLLLAGLIGAFHLGREETTRLAERPEESAAFKPGEKEPVL